uniref:Uncharacterized protein n=1 Tax=Cucumis melo TaxID=3656 RepID=A0A9I9EGB6_CUCME
MNHHKEREEREKAYSFDSTSLKAHRRAKAQEAYPSSKQAPMQELPFYSVLPYVLDVLDADYLTVRIPPCIPHRLGKENRSVQFHDSRTHGMSTRNFGSGNRSRSSSNVNEANNSNQNSIGEQEVVSIDSDIQSSSTKTKGRGATRGVGLEKYVQANGPIRIRIDFEDRKLICKNSSKLNSQIGKEKEEGKEVTEIELFQLTHSNEKKGWVNEAKAKYSITMVVQTRYPSNVLAIMRTSWAR